MMMILQQQEQQHQHKQQNQMSRLPYIRCCCRQEELLYCDCQHHSSSTSCNEAQNDGNDEQCSIFRALYDKNGRDHSAEDGNDDSITIQSDLTDDFSSSDDDDNLLYRHTAIDCSRRFDAATAGRSKILPIISNTNIHHNDIDVYSSGIPVVVGSPLSNLHRLTSSSPPLTLQNEHQHGGGARGVRRSALSTTSSSCTSTYQSSCLSFIQVHKVDVDIATASNRGCDCQATCSTELIPSYSPPIPTASLSLSASSAANISPGVDFKDMDKRKNFISSYNYHHADYSATKKISGLSIVLQQWGLVSMGDNERGFVDDEQHKEDEKVTEEDEEEVENDGVTTGLIESIIIQRVDNPLHKLILDEEIDNDWGYFVDAISE